MTRVGHRHLFAAHAPDRSIKLPECLLDDPGADFRRQADASPAFVNNDRSPGFGHRSDDRLVIERPQGAQIDDLGFDIVGGERGGGIQRLPQRSAISD